MMFRSFLLQALFGDTGKSKDSGGGGGINTTGNNAATFPKVVVGDEMSSSFPSALPFPLPRTMVLPPRMVRRRRRSRKARAW